LFAELATAAELLVSNFNLQELTNTAWAFATADQHDASLFAALAAFAKQNMEDFSTECLASTAWAFAVVG